MYQVSLSLLLKSTVVKNIGHIFKIEAVKEKNNFTLGLKIAVSMGSPLAQA